MVFVVYFTLLTNFCSSTGIATRIKISDAGMYGRLFIILALFTCALSERIIVKTENGYISGFSQNYENASVATFLGIPFAKPPINSLRFRKPVKPDPWDGVLNTSRYGPSCLYNRDGLFQPGDKYFKAMDMWNYKKEYDVSEDCLTLNVWAPYKDFPNQSLPVMLWIYGGGFFSGTSHLDVYNGHRLAALENVVVVTFNYRSGILGFLYLESVEAPGNQALYDQLMVLEWVRDNIAKFGGNPDQVTIFGESAGAASVGYHLLSPISQGLFKRAILQSGSPTAVWARFSQKEMLRRSKSFASKLQCESPAGLSQAESGSRIAQCLRSVDTMQISIVDGELFMETYPPRYLPFPVAPIIDGHIIVEDARFLLEGGYTKYTELLLGSNANEGSYWLLYYMNELFQAGMHPHEISRANYSLALNYSFPQFSSTLREAIGSFYINWNDPDNGQMLADAVDAMTGEHNFLCPVNEFAHFYSKLDRKQRIYMYHLTHRANAEVWPPWMGVIHGADCQWVFGSFLDDKKSTKADKELNRKILHFWANFARTGNPNRQSFTKFEREVWKRWTPEEQLMINLEPNLSVGRGPRAQRCAIFTQLLPTIQEYEEKQCSSDNLPLSSSQIFSWSLGSNYFIVYYSFYSLIKFLS
uniref:Carboxylic ester hydrolase n=1 Tax=Hofstenia miamia TaxID=442651 RepID=A0A7G7LK68_HOFMI|nr:acetylcholinesterase 1 [Hofstenia miamia]